MSDSKKSEILSTQVRQVMSGEKFQRDQEMQTSIERYDEVEQPIILSNRDSQGSCIKYQVFAGQTCRSDEFQRTELNLKGIKDLAGSY
jgi:hypothetical protein